MKTRTVAGGWKQRLMTWIGGLLLIAVVASIIAVIALIKYQQTQAAMSQPAPPESPVAVTLFDPQPTQFRMQTVVVGSVLAPQSVRLRNELTGLVTEVSMTPGDVVKTGDLLVQFDDRTEQAELKAALATQSMALASLERSKRLARANANSEQELDIAQAESTRAEAEVERLKTLIDRKRITARFDARVGIFELHAGQFLDAGSEITTLEGIADYLHVDFAMPAHVADAVEIGDDVLMQIDEASPMLSARLIAIDSRADPVSRSLKARAKLNAPPPTLLPGDSVRVTLEYGPTIDAILIPATAVRRGPSGTMVYTAAVAASGESPSNSDGSPAELRAKSQFIEIVGGGGTMNRVIGGLQPSDRVIADGSFKVAEGSLVVELMGDNKL